ncbi:MAG: hypothetical protein OXC41_06910 [Gammaproteobacteria bacterium]|nr:hypothetical protein [Gammaproteobacteria bacterium]
MPETEMPEPEEVTPSVELGDLILPANDYTIAAGETMDVGEGETEVTLSCSAAAACSFTVDEDGMATPTTGEVTAALSAAAMQASAAREEAARLAMEEEERMRMEAEQARIMGLTAAIADPDGDGRLAEPGDLKTDKRPSSDMDNLYGDGSITVDGDQLGKDNAGIRDAVEFQARNESRIALSSTFKSSVHVRTKDGKTDTLTVYSDSFGTKPEEFNTYYTATKCVSDACGTGITVVDVADDSDDVKTEYNTVNFPTDGTALVATVASRIGLSGASTYSITFDDDEDSKKGSFHGTPGTYSCGTAGGCTVARDQEGVITITGTVTFTPSDTVNNTQDVHMVPDGITDDDYLAFGYWIQTMSMGDDGMKYGVSTFAGGSMPFGNNTGGNSEIEALRGTATYDGSATGVYARKDLAVEDGNVVGTPVAAGQFSADVSLTAHFGNQETADVDVDHISANEMFTINGMVDNFQDANGDMIDNEWGLSLNPIHFSNAANDADSYTSTLTEGTTGKGAGMMGEWQGGFFGAVADADATPSQPTATTYPSGVAGEFTGHFTDGNVIGAFGATR